MFKPSHIARGYALLGQRLQPLDGLPSLLLRLYLVPVFWMAGMQKFQHFGDTVAWFGNPDWGLGLPLPWLLAFLATATELAGALLLLFGLGVRLISAPLAITMAVAALTVHWPNGWQAIADASAPFANEAVLAAPEKLARARDILAAHGNYDWLTSSGELVILNNGIEFAATYFAMCLALLALGGGRYVSLDYLIARALNRAPAPASVGQPDTGSAIHPSLS